MGNKKVSNQLGRSYIALQRTEFNPSAKRTRHAGRSAAIDMHVADPAADMMAHVVQHNAAAGRGGRQTLTPANLVRVGVAALLWTSGTQGRALLAGGLGPVGGPAPVPEMSFEASPVAVSPVLAPVAAPAPAPVVVPAAPPVPFSPFAVAIAWQNRDLMGDTRNATVFNRDPQGNVVIQASDVHQDIVHDGDCQTLSVMASVAHKNPALIGTHLRALGRNANGDNLFAVQVFKAGNWTTQNVTDVDLPGRGALQKSDVIWPRLYEAAVMQAYPEYDVLNRHLVNASEPSSGKASMDTGVVLNAVTGATLFEGNGDDGGNSLMDAVMQGSPATAGVAQGDLNWFGSFDTVDAQTGAKIDVSNPNAVTILGSHQFGLLNVTAEAPNRQVTLFNPYNYPGSGGSTFTVSESTFREYFRTGLAWT